MNELKEWVFWGAVIGFICIFMGAAKGNLTPKLKLNEKGPKKIIFYSRSVSMGIRG